MNLSQAGKKVAEFPILFVCGILTPLIVVLLVMRGPKVTQFEQELSALEREWHNIQTNVERASGMETDIERLEQGLEVVRQRLMQVDNVAVNYEFFFDLERESGIALSRFSQAPATDGADLIPGADGMKHFTAIPYDLSMAGTLEQITGFLDLLDRQRYIVRMEFLRLSPPPAGPGTAIDSTSLTGRLRCHVLAARND
jgi:hypothetical protein